MRIRALLILAITLLAVIALSGAALAVTKTCSEQPLRGHQGARHAQRHPHQERDPRVLVLTTSPASQGPTISTATGARMRCAPARAGTACSAAGERTSSTAGW